MPIRGPLIAPALRLRLGASVLAGARAVDTRPVKERLARFAREHRRYVAAQRQVTALERQLRAARARLSASDAAQDDAVEALARALVGDGHRRRRPFTAFGAPSPSTLARLPLADEASAVHQLVRAIELTTPIGKRTSQAARGADRAARAVARAMIRVEKAEARVRAARRTRDAVGRSWHTAYAALGHVARAARHEGAPELHAVLFPPASHVAAKRKRRVVAPPGVSRQAPTRSNGPVSA